MAKIRNAGSKRDVLTCACGGEVTMKTVFTNGKLKNFAECKKCKDTSRYPKYLKKLA